MSIRLREDLAHVLWLGGSACAGKSSAARSLADAHGLTLYGCDDWFEEHRRRAVSALHPHFHRLMDLPVAEQWLLSPARQARELLLFYEDELQMVMEDLRRLPGPVLAEGVGLLPARLAAALSGPHQACWLIATPGFRRLHGPRRAAWLPELLAGSADPAGAIAGWMARDDEVARRLAAQAARHALTCRIVDGSSSEQETAAALARHFRLA